LTLSRRAVERRTRAPNVDDDDDDDDATTTRRIVNAFVPW
jgi:hypothetical protein